MTLEAALCTQFTDTPKMWDIVDLTRKILVGPKSGRKGYPETHSRCRCCHPSLPYRCEVPSTSVRCEAIKLYLTHPRREGVWVAPWHGIIAYSGAYFRYREHASRRCQRPYPTLGEDEFGPDDGQYLEQGDALAWISAGVKGGWHYEKIGKSIEIQ